jgi:protein involved in polysaccharide export with SLBB domain
MRIKLFFVIALLLTVQSFAQSSYMRYPPEMATPRGNISLVPMVVESQVDSSYVVGPGDFFDLFLENNYFSVQVNADGTVAISECGVVSVGGKPLYEAKKEILNAVSKKYSVQYSSIQLSRLKSFMVTVMGAVPQTGQIPVDAQTKLSTLIRNIGGFLPTADQERVVVIRGRDSIKVDYNKIVRLGKFESDLVLMQGDQIFIPFVDMSAAVSMIMSDKRVSVPYREGRSVADYYMMVTGNDVENSGLRFIKIVGNDGSEKRITVPESRKTAVSAGAEVYCDNRGSNNQYVYVGGAVAAMGKVPYNPEYKALDYIAASGVTPITGTWNQVRVVRGNRETIDVNATEDEIFPGDYIEIPRSRYENFKDFTLFLVSLLTVVSSSFVIYMTYRK